MKKITKAIIPAAGFGTRFLPATKAQPKEMLPIVDTPTIQYIIEEAVASGITDICIVTSSQKRSIEDHFDRAFELEALLEKKNKEAELQLIKKTADLANIYFVRQKEAKGLGHAILTGKSFIGNDDFAVLLGDDVIYSPNNPVLKQMIDAHEIAQSTILGVQEVAEEQVSKYGVVSPVEEGKNVKISGMVEKPALEDAPSRKAVLGRYILTPAIFDYLETQEPGAGDEIQLTDSIERLISTEDVYAYTFDGERYDIGSKFGFVKATIDYALRNDELQEDVFNYIQQLANEK